MPSTINKDFFIKIQLARIRNWLKIFIKCYADFRSTFCRQVPIIFVNSYNIIFETELMLDKRNSWLFRIPMLYYKNSIYESKFWNTKYTLMVSSNLNASTCKKRVWTSFGTWVLPKFPQGKTLFGQKWEKLGKISVFPIK